MQMVSRYPLPPLWPLARLTVALPLANPTPRPLVPLDLNIGAFLFNPALASLSAILPLSSASCHKAIPQHVRHNEKPNVAPSYVHLIQM